MTENWKAEIDLPPTGHGGIAITSSDLDYNVANVYLNITNTNWPWEDQIKRPENLSAVKRALKIAASNDLYDSLVGLLQSYANLKGTGINHLPECREAIKAIAKADGEVK